MAKLHWSAARKTVFDVQGWDFVPHATKDSYLCKKALHPEVKIIERFNFIKGRLRSAMIRLEIDPISPSFGDFSEMIQNLTKALDKKVQQSKHRICLGKSRARKQNERQ